MDFFYFLRKNGSLIIFTHYQPITAIKMSSLQRLHKYKEDVDEQMHPINQWALQSTNAPQPMGIAVGE